jgi:tRNA A-37 threonylcarbamoyl transferase component Bud32
VTDTLTRLQSGLAARYRIEREIGRGATATVYLAHDLKHGRRVAIKVLHPALSVSVGADRFLREIWIVAKLAHPHILPLHDSGVEHDVLYYVMPYVAGQSLRTRLIERERLPLVDVLAIAADVADALDYAHAVGVVHRDVKPENVLVYEGRAVVADFGIARLVDIASTGTSGALTYTDTIIGTPRYMSPEQGAGEPSLDGRSDQYSLACMTYEMLAGEPPFAGTARRLIVAHLTEPPPAIETRRGGLPAHVGVALMRALAKSPDQRFENCWAFAAALSGERPLPESSGLDKEHLGGPRRRVEVVSLPLDASSRATTSVSPLEGDDTQTTMMVAPDEARRASTAGAWRVARSGRRRLIGGVVLGGLVAGGVLAYVINAANQATLAAPSAPATPTDSIALAFPVAPVDSLQVGVLGAPPATPSVGSSALNRPVASLSISAPGATIRLNGAVVGRGTMKLDTLSPGTYMVRASLPSSEGCSTSDTTATVMLAPRDVREISLNLRACGTLTIIPLPSPARYTLQPVGGGAAKMGTLAGTSSVLLPEGRYRLTVSAPACANYEGEVTVSAAGTETKRVLLLCGG